MPTRRDLANAIRALSMDAVQKANSGHPGMPMGMADIAEVLWNDFLQHNPTNPAWSNRDRFVLSNGHGSMLQYALLHLTGYDVSIDDLKNFRQLHSKTPGHPEVGYTPGVETTTGPLGQGLSNAVGMAIAEKMLATTFNRDGYPIVDHYSYVFLGDGCLMEGISHEAASLAGTLGLGKLIALYDDNGISIDGEVEGWFTDDTAMRFHAYHWHVVTDVDGHDSDAIRNAIEIARKVTDKPSLIICKTIIGYGAPTLAGTEKTHGAPLGEKEIQATRTQLNWPHAPFVVPGDIKGAWDATEKGAAKEREWNALFQRYQQAHPQLATEFTRRMRNELPEAFAQTITDFISTTQSSGESIASRKASLNVLNALTPIVPELLGGSADLTGSNLTMSNSAKAISKENMNGNYLFYGVREFGMSAIMNGLSLHGGFIPFGGTFLTFSDYARNAVRLCALMKKRNIFVYTHDSIGLGEDGPTHQPIEHAASLRLIPNLSVWRPCDAVETAVAWECAITRTNGPTALLLSRQTLPHQQREAHTTKAIYRGGYILRDCQGEPEVILIATGSEVSLAVNACDALTAKGRRIRVVSLPCTDHFDRQDDHYRHQVLPPHITKRVAIEAGIADYWYKYVGFAGTIAALKNYGESAPAEKIFDAMGLTTAHIIETVNSIL